MIKQFLSKTPKIPLLVFVAPGVVGSWVHKNSTVIGHDVTIALESSVERFVNKPTRIESYAS